MSLVVFRDFHIACTLLTVRLGARLLRLGLLLTSSRAALSDVLRQLRLNP